jgi:hypothetical protein
VFILDEDIAITNANVEATQSIRHLRYKIIGKSVEELPIEYFEKNLSSIIKSLDVKDVLFEKKCKEKK